MQYRTILSSLITIACLLGNPLPPAQAHGELHELIEEVSQAIVRHPYQPKLYLERARLHRAHLGWDAAMADLERAASLTNDWHQLHFDRAELYLDVQWYDSAVVSASRFLTHEPHHGAALVLRARARAKLGQFLAAAEDYTQAINHSSPPTPEMFLERAEAQANAGSEYLPQALRGLEEGLEKLGALATLQQAAIDFELKQNKVDAALARLDANMAQYPRKESWLAQRGKILREAGRLQEAIQAYQAAWQALQSLPPNLRRVPAMASLKETIQTALAELDPAAATATKNPNPRP